MGRPSSRCAAPASTTSTSTSHIGSGSTVVRVPSYSPNAVAEHTIALMLALNRHIHRAHNRVRDGNFSLDGLVGFDMAGKTAAVIGTGKIGVIVARLLWHLRCDVIAVDPYHDEHLVELGVRYVDLDEALSRAHIVTLNCPLTDGTYHLIDTDAGRHGCARERCSSTPDAARLVDTAAVARRLEVGTDRFARPRRLRGGGRPVLRGPQRRDHRRRRLRPSADVPERADHRAPGVPHA